MRRLAGLAGRSFAGESRSGGRPAINGCAVTSPGKAFRAWPWWAGTALALTCLLLGSTRGEASLSVSPALIDLEIGNGRPSGVFTVTNVTDQETRYRVQVVHFVFTREGSIQMVPPDEHSLASWIKCNPLEFTLPGKASRAIRYTLVPPKSLTPGEYWAAVWFEPLTESLPPAQDTLHRRAIIKVVTNILVPIFARMPTVTHRCELADLTAARTTDGLSISARLTNTGSAHLRVKGTYEVLSSSGTQVAQGPFGDDTILAGGERVFEQAVKGKFPDSEYTVRVRYESKRLTNVLGGQTSVR